MDIDDILDDDFDNSSEFSDSMEQELELELERERIERERTLDGLQAAFLAEVEPWDMDDAEAMDFLDPESPLSTVDRNSSDSESEMFVAEREGGYYNDEDEEEEEEDVGDNDDEIVVIAENPNPISLPHVPGRERESARQREARQRDYDGGGRQRERRRSASPANRRYGLNRHPLSVDELVDLDFFPPRNLQPRTLHQQPRQQPHLAMNNRHQNHNNNNSHQPAAIIDLTDEPDSPPAPRNPRRQMSNSQRNPPALARSDGSLLGAPVIDLTLEELPEHDPRNQNGPIDPNDDEVLFVRNNRRPDNVMPLNFEIAHFADLANGLAQGVLHRLVGHRFRHVFRQQPDPNPLGANMPDLNYVHGARNNRPAYEEPAAAPEGFTRETGQLAEDEILVCPGCDSELAYDPDSEDEFISPSKKSGKATRGKTKEQRFWLVKECGHVYCRKCFDNRRPKTKLWSTTKWRLEDGTCADGTHWTDSPQQPLNQGRRRTILCAVEDCSANVAEQKAWVGIFM